MASINWQLFNNNKLVIDKQNVFAKVTSKEIIYIDEYGRHEIDLNNNIYRRIADDNIMQIDFKNNLLSFEFDNHKLNYDSKTKCTRKDGKINLLYTIGDDKFEIAIESEIL